MYECKAGAQCSGMHPGKFKLKYSLLRQCCGRRDNPLICSFVEVRACLHLYRIVPKACIHMKEISVDFTPTTAKNAPAASINTGYPDLRVHGPGLGGGGGGV